METNGGKNANINRPALRQKVSVGKSTKLVPYGDAEFKADKLFFSPVKEEEWINSLASQGYALVGRKFAGYIYEANKYADRYYYSVSLLPAQAETEISESVIEERAKRSAYPVCTFSDKAYYKTPLAELGEDIVKDAAQKRRHLKRTFIFNLCVLAFFLGLLCYNMVYWTRFDAAGITADKSAVIWKFAINMSALFGNSPATPYISICLVCTLLAMPFTIYFFDQYMYSRAFEKTVKKACQGK